MKKDPTKSLNHKLPLGLPQSLALTFSYLLLLSVDATFAANKSSSSSRVSFPIVVWDRGSINEKGLVTNEVDGKVSWMYFQLDLNQNGRAESRSVGVGKELVIQYDDNEDGRVDREELSNSEVQVHRSDRVGPRFTTLAISRRQPDGVLEAEYKYNPRTKRMDVKKATLRPYRIYYYGGDSSDPYAGAVSPASLIARGALRALTENPVAPQTIPASTPVPPGGTSASTPVSPEPSTPPSPAAPDPAATVPAAAPTNSASAPHTLGSLSIPDGAPVIASPPDPATPGTVAPPEPCAEMDPLTTTTADLNELFEDVYKKYSNSSDVIKTRLAGLISDQCNKIDRYNLQVGLEKLYASLSPTSERKGLFSCIVDGKDLNLGERKIFIGALHKVVQFLDQIASPQSDPNWRIQCADDETSAHSKPAYTDEGSRTIHFRTINEVRLRTRKNFDNLNFVSHELVHGVGGVADEEIANVLAKNLADCDRLKEVGELTHIPQGPEKPIESLVHKNDVVNAAADQRVKVGAEQLGAEVSRTQISQSSTLVRDERMAKEIVAQVRGIPSPKPEVEAPTLTLGQLAVPESGVTKGTAMSKAEVRNQSNSLSANRGIASTYSRNSRPGLQLSALTGGSAREVRRAPPTLGELLALVDGNRDGSSIRGNSFSGNAQRKISIRPADGAGVLPFDGGGIIPVNLSQQGSGPQDRIDEVTGRREKGPTDQRASLTSKGSRASGGGSSGTTASSKASPAGGRTPAGGPGGPTEDPLAVTIPERELNDRLTKLSQNPRIKIICNGTTYGTGEEVFVCKKSEDVFQLVNLLDLSRGEEI